MTGNDSRRTGKRRLRAWAIAVAGIVVALPLLLVAAGWLLLRGSLPAIDGAQAVPGLVGEVRVSRDANGTVTIDAGSEADALHALGFVHAQERYFEMDLMRRSAAGELSALFGARALPLDREHRLHRLRARTRAGMDDIAGEQRLQLDAYVEGVNAGVSALRIRPWAYLLLRQAPQPWRAEDTPLVGFAMYFDLQGGRDDDSLALWQAAPHLPPALLALLRRDGTRWDAPMLGTARGDAALPDAASVDLRALPAPAGGLARTEAHAPGSNNFAVAGSLTGDGRAIVADDMHLSMRAPSIWFRARLRYPDAAAPGGKVDVQGFTLPGLPLVVVGGNGHVAWGFTNSYADSMDWKLETTCASQPRQGCARIEAHQETIDVAGAAPERLLVEESAWGPVLQHLPDGRVLSLRWIAHQPGAVNLGLARFARARSVEDVLALADTTAVPTQNLVVGDRAGNIAWRLLGPLAQRAPACTPAPPVIDPASVDCPPWPISTSASPVLRSPEHARLWTANARVLDGDALATVGDGGYALGARAAQIRDTLMAARRFDERDLLAIQLDDRALFLAPWHALLGERAAAAKTPALAALAAASVQWDGRASVDSVSYRIVRDWRLAVSARIAAGLLAPARAALGDDWKAPSLPQLEGIAWPLLQQRPPHLLPRPYASWDGLLEDAAVEVRDRLQAKGPLQERSWGERNAARICHPLSSALGWFGTQSLCMPAQALAGDANMPRVVGPAFGASQRMVVAPGHEFDGIIEMPGGQSGHPLSPFWGAGHADWVNGVASPYLPGRTQHVLRLLPAAPAGSGQ